MRHAIITACALALLAGCAVTSEDAKDSPLRHVTLVVGMKRLDAEQAIADATGLKSRYDIHAMDTSREVQYRDGDTILVVKYKPGAPAPLFTNNDGQVQGLPPIDGEVISWTVETVPEKKKE
jgi:hypothetical protein